MILQGFDVHHVDGNHQNDDPGNLVLMESNDHMQVMHESGFVVKPLSRRKIFTVVDILRLVSKHYADAEERKKRRYEEKRRKRLLVPEGESSDPIVPAIPATDYVLETDLVWDEQKKKYIVTELYTPLIARH